MIESLLNLPSLIECMSMVSGEINVLASVTVVTCTALVALWANDHTPWAGPEFKDM